MCLLLMLPLLMRASEARREINVSYRRQLVILDALAARTRMQCVFGVICDIDGCHWASTRQHHSVSVAADQRHS